MLHAGDVGSSRGGFIGKIMQVGGGWMLRLDRGHCCWLLNQGTVGFLHAACWWRVLRRSPCHRERCTLKATGLKGVKVRCTG